MPTTILDGETYSEALQRRYAEETKAEKQSEIIRMAREAGFVFPETQEDSFTCWWEELERFFNLAFAAGAAHERKKFMALCEAEYKKYDELVTEEDVGHEEATAIIHLMRKLEGMK